MIQRAWSIFFCRLLCNHSFIKRFLLRSRSRQQNHVPCILRANVSSTSQADGARVAPTRSGARHRQSINSTVYSLHPQHSHVLMACGALTVQYTSSCAASCVDPCHCCCSQQRYTTSSPRCFSRLSASATNLHRRAAIGSDRTQNFCFVNLQRAS